MKFKQVGNRCRFPISCASFSMSAHLKFGCFSHPEMCDCRQPLDDILFSRKGTCLVKHSSMLAFAILHWRIPVNIALLATLDGTSGRKFTPPREWSQKRQANQLECELVRTSSPSNWVGAMRFFLLDSYHGLRPILCQGAIPLTNTWTQYLSSDVQLPNMGSSEFQVLCTHNLFFSTENGSSTQSTLNNCLDYFSRPVNAAQAMSAGEIIKLIHLSCPVGVRRLCLAGPHVQRSHR